MTEKGNRQIERKINIRQNAIDEKIRKCENYSFLMGA